MKKLIAIFSLLLVTTLIFSQGSRRYEFTLTSPFGTDTTITLPGYSAGAYSYVIDFGGSNALDATYSFGVDLDEGDLDFSAITFPDRTFPVTINLTNCPDTVCWGERQYLPFYDIKLKYTKGTVTPGTVFTGRIIYTR